MASPTFRLSLLGKGLTVKQQVSRDVARTIVDIVLSSTESEEDNGQVLIEELSNDPSLQSFRELKERFGLMAVKLVKNGREIVSHSIRNKMKKAKVLSEDGRVAAFFPGTWPYRVYAEISKQTKKAKTEKINASEIARSLKSPQGAIASALTVLHRLGKVKKKGEGRGTRWRIARPKSSS